MILLLKNYKKVRILSLISSIIIMIALSIYKPEFKARIIDETINQINFSNKKYIFSKEHESLYRTSINIFKDNKILGVGPKRFRKVCAEEKYNIPMGCSTHSHNTYLQLLSETGLIGFSFMIILFVFLVFFSLKHFFESTLKKKFFFTDFQICLLSYFLITLWPLAPTGNFFNNWLSIIYYYPLGFFLWSLKRKSETFKNT